jgi:hypothetical protein
VLASAELYDPATETWAAADAMTVPRSGHPGTLLPDGRVLVAGGVTPFVNPFDSRALASAELFDPASGRWVAAAAMPEPRFDQTSTLLPDGRVLLAFGSAGFGRPSASALLYDPASDSWAPITGAIEPH